MKKLYRSRRDKKLFGLCGGLAEMLNVDVTLLRILLIVLTIFTSGGVILVYIFAGLVVPKEPTSYSGFGPNGHGFGYGNGNGNGGSYNPGFGAGNSGEMGSQSPFGSSYNNSTQSTGTWGSTSTTSSGGSSSQFDSMMDDLEKKALRREIEELKAKIAKYEKGDF